jgi:hypothetical protein
VGEGGRKKRGRRQDKERRERERERERGGIERERRGVLAPATDGGAYSACDNILQLHDRGSALILS